MNEDKIKKNNFKKAIKRVLLIQFLIFICLLIIDLYFFKGFYTSKVIIQPSIWSGDRNYSCKLKIKKTADKKYLFTFKNNSLIPKYFINYRDYKHFQNVTDTLFFDYLGKNLFPAYGFDYSYSFNCGTGLGYTSINPFETYKIEKSYEDIIKECSSREVLKKSEFLYIKSKKEYFKLRSNEIEIDSLLKDENQLVLETDTIQVEYYMPMHSFISKNKIYTVSNKINVSIKDLLNQYRKHNTLKD